MKLEIKFIPNINTSILIVIDQLVSTHPEKLFHLLSSTIWNMILLRLPNTKIYNNDIHFHPKLQIIKYKTVENI